LSRFGDAGPVSKPFILLTAVNVVLAEFVSFLGYLGGKCPVSKPLILLTALSAVMVDFVLLW
jgi:hypothetical protein